MKQIDNMIDLRRWLAKGPAAEPAAIQALDLREVVDFPRSASLQGSLFLGCEIAPTDAAHVVEAGGVVLPPLPFRFAVHRAFLYDVPTLFDGFDIADPDGYFKTFDHRVYEEYVEQGRDRPDSIMITLARRLHDHSMTDALHEVIDSRNVVAIMGGHGMERSDPFYRGIAEISRSLTRDGFLMVSGGGPGAMEATHLGAFLAARQDSALDEALGILRARPGGGGRGKEYADHDWLHRAWRVRQKFPLALGDQPKCMSVGIPTWLYGHEPPAPFATHFAKYFANSVREDGLLTIAEHGVIFAPGGAGTTQEIFQDATQNHYGTVGVISPMILYGTRHWTEKRPVWPLLQHVAKGRKYGELLALTDDTEEIVRRIRTYDPARYSV